MTRSLAVWPLYTLFFASGFAALVYQVMWARGFGLVFGSTARAAAVVVAAFFLGMAVGNLLGARWARRRASALLLYAVAELAIAAGALLVLFWVDLYRAQYPVLYQSRFGHAGALTVLQVSMAFAALAVPCVAMGATLPLMSRALVRSAGHMGRRVAGAYALNTAGATVGALLSGFALPIWMGVRNTVYLAAAVNLSVAVGAFVLWISWRSRVLETGVSEAPAPVPAQTAAASPPHGAALAFVAAASGFATLALEVLYVRLLVNRTDSSVYSFAVVLSTFLLALAIGSGLVSALVERCRSPWKLIGWSSSLAAVLIMLSPRAFLAAPAALPTQLLEWGYLSWLVVFSLLLIGPGVALAGMSLPTAWKIATAEVGDVGRRVGHLTAINTLAGVIGSLTAGFLLIPLAGLNRGFALVACVYGAMAAVAWMRGGAGSWRWGPIAAVAAALAALLVTGDWSALPLKLRSGERVIHYSEGEAGAVAVTRLTRGTLRLRVNSAYTLSSSAPRSQRVQRGQTRLGLGLLEKPRTVAFIGVGAGITVSAVTEFPTIERVVAMEVIPGVIEAARAFETVNRWILEDDRVEVVVADGRNHLSGIPDRFDVIVGDLFVPWHAGTGYLYTAEHFRIVADRLAPGGVFVQWLQADQVSLAELRIITATFLDVFEDADLWLNRKLEGIPLVGLVGRERSGGLPQGRQLPADPVFADLEHVCEASVLRLWVEAAPRNTDDYPVIEFRAGASHLERSSAETERVVRFLLELCSGAEGDR